MWEQLKTSRSGVVILLKYADFATIEVEKKTNNSGMTFYEVSFHIEGVTDQSVTAHRIESVSRVLEVAKGYIEDLYEDIEDYTGKDLYDWLDDFVDAINDF